MRCISLLQPWASLVVIGAKRIETRSWNTKHRGDLLIHASAKRFKPVKGMEKLMEHMLWCGFFDQVPHMPYGAIIGHVNVLETFPTSMPMFKGDYVNAQLTYKENSELDISNSCVYMTSQEEAFGDYTRGRFCWLLADAIKFDKPIPAKGALSIWKFPDIIEVVKKPLPGVSV